MKPCCACCLVLLTGCTGLANQADVPALLVMPSSAARAELQQTVSRLTGVQDVVLADDALTSTDLLSIERTPARDSEGRPLNGRELGRPEVFRLVVKGSTCVLLHDRSRTRTALKAATCRAKS